MTFAARAPTLATDRRAVLHRLLDDSLQLAAEYGAGMASHLPMALAALDGLGADEARMRAFFAHYARQLHRIGAPPKTAMPLRDWPSLRGHAGAFDALRAFFADALGCQGRDTVLRDALPALIDGTAGAALHGPIRVAHAVESGHDAELAAALAYWAMRWQTLPAPAASGVRFEDAAAWLDALDARMREVDATWRPSARLISDRMQQAALTAAYVELAGSLDTSRAMPAALLLDLAKTAAARYAATGNFTVLHMATASRAMQVLAEWLPSDIGAWAPLLHAVAAASLASRAVPLRSDVTAVPLGWSEVRRLACASDDDHVIKFVHAMFVQDRRTPDAVWLAAARVALKS